MHTVFHLFWSSATRHHLVAKQFQGLLWGVSRTRDPGFALATSMEEEMDEDTLHALALSMQEVQTLLCLYSALRLWQTFPFKI